MLQNYYFFLKFLSSSFAIYKNIRNYAVSFRTYYLLWNKYQYPWSDDWQQVKGIALDDERITLKMTETVDFEVYAKIWSFIRSRV